MKKEFDLSENIMVHNDFLEECISTEDVKEFIRLLKEYKIYRNNTKYIIIPMRIFDKLAGKELIESGEE